MKREESKKNELLKVRGACQNNLKDLDLDIPRHKFVVFTGVSGSGKSSLAFDTLYAEAQRRYFESLSPYARRFLDQLPAPKVKEISGLPPAVALSQRRVEAGGRSTVGTLSSISNSIRLLFSRSGTYPSEDSPRLDSDHFSANTAAGACPLCHGMGIIYSVSESSLVPNPNLSIRENAIAAWPGAWQGKNFRDILATLGYDIDKPFKDLPEKDRHWILFTEERPVVTIYAEREAHRIQRPYQGTYMSAACYVRHTFAKTESAALRKRAAAFMDKSLCHECKGKRLKKESLLVRFAGYDIAELGQVPVSTLADILKAGIQGEKGIPEDYRETAVLIGNEILERLESLNELGISYLALDRKIATLSSGELQRLRLSTQLHSGLFGVVYVLDEPSAGMHPSETEALYAILERLLANGNSLFVVEHDMELISRADWVIDVGPGAGDAGGKLLYSGPVSGLEAIKESETSRFLFRETKAAKRAVRKFNGLLKLNSITRNNLHDLDLELPLSVLTAITGVSGAGKSTLMKVVAESLQEKLYEYEKQNTEEEEFCEDENIPATSVRLSGAEKIDRMVFVDQKPIGRTPRSNLATYTGLFDAVRHLYSKTDEAKRRGYKAGRFSFNVVGGRCEHCQGEGYVTVELLFLPSVYSPCTQCRSRRYNEETLQIKYRGLDISQILELSVEQAREFFKDLPQAERVLKILADMGLAYLRLGQPAPELSGGEAQRIKLASELQRAQKGHTLYLLDEPSTGLHPADLEKLMNQLQALVDLGNTVVLVEHDLKAVAQADWVIDMGPGAAEKGGRIVAAGSPAEITGNKRSRTAKFLAHELR